MQVTIDVKESALEQVMYILRNLSDVKVLQDREEPKKLDAEDLFFLEAEIEKGLGSGRSDKSHAQIIDELKQKYA
ncbi:MAG: hypothetical protein U9R27_04000 [Campylobacterota bacterium]|nr:hypothetical protein [Campylobacterota bacterium]